MAGRTNLQEDERLVLDHPGCCTSLLPHCGQVRNMSVAKGMMSD